MPKKIKVAIFVSGSGSNAENICNYFQSHPQIEIASFYCNNPLAFAIERAVKLNLPCHVFSKTDFLENGKVHLQLQAENIDFIVLSGFLWLFPKYLVEAYPQRIINIHPALLPHFGGKGMYGMKVHLAVKQSGEKETGITIHIVNENYDEGSVIFQTKTIIDDIDTPEIIADKVHALEFEYFPQIIEQTILKIF